LNELWRAKYLNKILCGDCLNLIKDVPNETIDLVIADPPYFKVIGEKWDYVWRTLEDYLDWSHEWLKEVSRVLRLGGSLYLFGYLRILAYIIPKLEVLGLEFKQQIVIDKGMQAVSGRATKNYKIFPNTTESVLLIIKDNKKWLKKFLKEKQKEKGWSSKQINDKLGVKSNGGGMWSIYTGKNICEQFPTKDRWAQFEKLFEFSLPYEKVSQVFNPIMGFTNVWRDIDFYKEDRIHPTQKPLKLIQRLIEASSNQDDVILDPFLGSGTTAVASVMLKRNYIGFEINEDYINLILKRLKNVDYESRLIKKKDVPIDKFL
jgi:site-specific DNA-methyltransferase (adenine-specific)